MFSPLLFVLCICGLTLVNLQYLRADLIQTTWPLNAPNCPPTVVPYSMTFIRVNFCYRDPQSGRFQMTTCNSTQFSTVAYNDPLCFYPNQTVSQGSVGTCERFTRYTCGPEPSPPWTDFSITQNFDGACGQSNIISVTLTGVGCFVNTSNYGYFCDSNQTTLQTACPPRSCANCAFSTSVYQIGCVNTTRTVCTVNGVVPPLVLTPTTFIPSSTPSPTSNAENMHSFTTVSSLIVISLLTLVIRFLGHFHSVQIEST